MEKRYEKEDAKWRKEKRAWKRVIHRDRKYKPQKGRWSHQDGGRAQNHNGPTRISLQERGTDVVETTAEKKRVIQSAHLTPTYQVNGRRGRSQLNQTLSTRAEVEKTTRLSLKGWTANRGGHGDCTT